MGDRDLALGDVGSEAKGFPSHRKLPSHLSSFLNHADQRLVSVFGVG
jgi:hypothetical protein